MLWNAHAPELRRRLTLALPKQLAARVGITRKTFRQAVRLSYARVIEYQRRGLIHFHCVIRLDGPEGPDQAPPPWATPEVLNEAIRAAADDVEVAVPHPDGQGDPLVLGWGRQVDVQPIHVASELDGIADKHVARYIAKYATKGAEASGTVDRPIRFASQIGHLKVNEHTRRMIWTCFALADVPAYQDFRLRQWAHMLGYRGHFSTKSRRYSVTLTQLRQTRADYRATQTHKDETGTPEHAPATITVQEWGYAGSGLLHGEHFWAEQARNRTQTARRIRREITERERTHEAS